MPVRLVASVRFRVATLVVFAALPMLAVVLHLVAEDRQLLQREARDNVVRLARLAAADQRRLIDSVDGLTETLAAAARAATPEVAAGNRVLRSLCNEYPWCLNLAVANAAGDVVRSAVEPLRPVNVADRLWFRQSQTHPGLAFGGWEIGPIVARPVICFAHTTFAPDADDRPAGAVIAMVALDGGDRFVSSADLPAGATLTLVEPSGRVLARVPDAQAWTGRSLASHPFVRMLLDAPRGATEATGLDGIPRLYAWAPVMVGDTTFAHVAVGLMPSVAFETANRTFLLTLALAAAATIMVLLAAWFGTEWFLTRRLRAVGAAAIRLSSGDLTTTVDVGGDDEVTALGHSFNDMAGRLAAIAARDARANIELSAVIRGMTAERTRDVTVVSNTGSLLQNCHSVDEVALVLQDALRTLFAQSSVSVFLATGATAHLTEYGADSGTREAPFGPHACWAMRQRQPHLVYPGGDAPACAHVAARADGWSLCVPLSSGGRVLGFMHLTAPFDHVALPGHAPGGAAASPPVAEAVADTISRVASRTGIAVTLAEQGALALANVTLVERLRVQSVRDPLTGLFNRRYLEETLDREVHRAVRGTRSLSVIALDLDHFKDVNDAHGHAAGDAVLRTIGSTLIASFRGEDVACRAGGDEFVVLLPDAALADALQRARDLARTIATTVVMHAGAPLPAVTVSAGVAQFPTHGATGEAVLAAADAALYRAKADGRNGVVAAG